ncbi:hypothetical protein MLD52_22420 [Puniceicoccaceae bacterium K14]|nr:hypothetical protein [Puniceicoccaceae bacterium K14]
MGSIFFTLLLISPFFAAILLLSGILAWVLKKKKIFIGGIGICTAMIALVVANYVLAVLESPESKFERLVIDLLPSGVSELKGEWDLNTLDPNYFFSMELTPEAFEEIKRLRKWEKNSDLHNQRLFPKGWISDLEGHVFESYQFIDESYAFHYLIYSASEQRCLYGLITI